MYSQEMYQLGSKRSVIRELFEYGKKRSAEIGAENVFDFSLGNPNVPAPQCVKDAIIDLLNEPDSTKIHGYTSAQGDFLTRKTIADHINNKYGAHLSADSIYMTAGAAASLCITLKALTAKGDEFITFAPFFPEYTVFVNASGASLKVVPIKEDDFMLNLDAFTQLLSQNTKGVIVNSPNNPSGVVYPKEAILALTAILKAKEQEYGHPIYLISDEPYREIVYNNIEVPYLTNYYDNTIVCYSYSKALSLPGERIGYIAVSEKLSNEREIYAAICGAGRALGYVCAPSLFQMVIQKCVNAQTDLTVYNTNRDLIYNGLTALGYKCIRPDGAFYLFVKALESDATAFCEKAKKHELLLVAGDSFGAKGYVRISYCVATAVIINSLPSFAALKKEYDEIK